MTQISAKIVADSINEFGGRITTMLLTFPRIILAEFNTHRAFSRNTASSRAIPFEKMVKSVEENPFIPIAWQKNHKGMQGSEYFSNEGVGSNQLMWLTAKNYAVKQAKELFEFGTTKQLANRLLEPFSYVTVLCTATEWENFFNLRCPQYEIKVVNKFTPQFVSINENGDASMQSTVDEMELKYFRSRKDLLAYATFNSPPDESDWRRINKGQAEIHMMALAEAMWDAYNESTPKLLGSDEWHIPYEDKIRMDTDLEGNWGLVSTLNQISSGARAKEVFEEQIAILKRKIATVMCARTSYTVVGEDQKELTYYRMIELHDQLKNANPVHASPFEHCAQNIGIERSRNFTGGWKQYRDILSI